jgi:hypothetical protein
MLVQMLRHTLEGLQHMHDHSRLHQSLGPDSVILSTIQERDAATMTARIRDLAFSVDMSHEALQDAAAARDLSHDRYAGMQSEHLFLFPGDLPLDHVLS